MECFRRERGRERVAGRRKDRIAIGGLGEAWSLTELWGGFLGNGRLGCTGIGCIYGVKGIGNDDRVGFELGVDGDEHGVLLCKGCAPWVRQY